MISAIKVLILVFSPISLPVPKEASPEDWATLKKIASYLELAGPGCPWTENFNMEVSWVKLRHSECQGCPSVSDIRRVLPDHYHCKARLDEANLVLEYLLRAQVERLHWQDRLEEPIRQTKWVVSFWALAVRATDEEGNKFLYQRRTTMRELKTLLGDENYYGIQLRNQLP